jgi:hypothetical protein
MEELAIITFVSGVLQFIMAIIILFVLPIRANKILKNQETIKTNQTQIIKNQLIIDKKVTKS